MLDKKGTSKGMSKKSKGAKLSVAINCKGRLSKAPQSREAGRGPLVIQRTHFLLKEGKTFLKNVKCLCL